MPGTVIQFPVRHTRTSAPDEKMSGAEMIESLRRLSLAADSFAKQTRIFTEKVAAVRESCQKASDILGRI